MRLYRHLAILAVFLCCSCSESVKLSGIRSGRIAPRLELPRKTESVRPERNYAGEPLRDTLSVTGPDGRRMLIMKAVRDDETGEMVATEQLRPAYVSARFRNVAERQGRVLLEFQVIVPAEMHDPRWQLRFHPQMHFLGDTLCLEDVLITGEAYRKAQLRGYEQYRRFLSRIITDTTRLYFMHDLEVFLERNLPEVYAFRSDSSFVSDEVFMSAYGVSGQEAVEHYRRHLLTLVNERREGRSGKVMARFVRSPITSLNVRLDTVMVNADGDFVYNYIQPVRTVPGLRKVDIVLDGDIFEQDTRLYTLPRTGPLTFYISSLSTLADNREKYLTEVLERRVEETTACYVDFAAGHSDVDSSLGNNGTELSRIKENFREILGNDLFVLDSVVITAHSSPEGNEAMNLRLSASRADGVASYFSAFLRGYQDSLAFDAGFAIDEGGKISSRDVRTAVRFVTRSAGENWDYLDRLVENDPYLTAPAKADYGRIRSEVADCDGRDRSLGGTDYYSYLRNELYPRLRTVDFDFHLHRRDLVKDTVHTTVLDTVYMKGVEAIRNRDYESAVKLLATYRDYNTAVAYVALDRNMSAMEILGRLEPGPKENYLLAIVLSRLGDDGAAVEHFLLACDADPQFVHRGNLDPEISELIRTYDLEL